MTQIQHGGPLRISQKRQGPGGGASHAGQGRDPVNPGQGRKEQREASHRQKRKKIPCRGTSRKRDSRSRRLGEWKRTEPSDGLGGHLFRNMRGPAEGGVWPCTVTDAAGKFTAKVTQPLVHLDAL